MSQTPLLSVQHIGHRFLDKKKSRLGKAVSKQALYDVSFTLNKGQTLSIVGEGGSGKSTLARVLGGLIRPNEGHVYFDNTDIYSAKKDQLPYLRRNMRMVFQNPNASLNPRLTIGKQLEFALQNLTQLGSRQRIDRINEALSLVGLQADHKDHYPHQFSSGQRQRVAIARAILLNPQLIIADEPISMLDSSVQAQILNLLRELQQQRDLSYVLVSNDLSVAKLMSNQILVLYGGEVMEYGPVDALFQTPKHPYTRALFAASPNTRSAMQVPATPLRGELGSAGLAINGCPLSRRCPFADEQCKVTRPERRLVDQQIVFCHKVESI